MKFNILTLFPEMFAGYLGAGILGRAQADKLIQVNIVNIRDFGDGKHKVVDDTPYGGGAGMVLKIEPIALAIDSIDRDEIPPNPPLSRGVSTRTVVLSARGKQFDQRKAEEYAKLDNLTLICGRYEGIDQRVADNLADEEISIGPYVLNGGEVAAMTILEAVSRLIPGVLGNAESLSEESFNAPASSTPNFALRASLGRPGDKVDSEPGLPAEALAKAGVFPAGEYPQYTRPEEFNGWKVPEVLLSGDHEKIKEWREKHR